MIHRWLAGDDVDGSGRPLPVDRAWQAELWRRLRAEIGSPSPAERIRTAAAQLAESPAGTDLPSRLSLFGATRIDPDHLLVLRSLASHRDVHLWLPHPSPTLWDRIEAATGDAPVLGSRAATPTAAAAEHRLLGYLGRDARELQLMLAVSAGEPVAAHRFRTPCCRDPTHPPDSPARLAATRHRRQPTAHSDRRTSGAASFRSQC